MTVGLQSQSVNSVEIEQTSVGKNLLGLSIAPYFDRHPNERFKGNIVNSKIGLKT